MNDHRRPSNYERHVERLLALSREINAAIQSGRFYERPFLERLRQVRTITREYRALLGPSGGGRLARAALTACVLLLALFGSSETGEAQEQKRFASPVANPFGLNEGLPSYWTAVAFADIDADGDLDAFVGDYSYYYDAGLFYFQNTGTASKPSFSRPSRYVFGFESVPDAMSSPALVDIDADGDYDLFIQGKYNDQMEDASDPYEGYGAIYYYENTGDAEHPRFEGGAINPFGITHKVGRSAYCSVYVSKICFVDIDADGDLDLFQGGYYCHDEQQDKSSYGPILYFENVGMASSPAFAAPEIDPFGIEAGLEGQSAFSFPAFADIDADGDYDAFVGMAQEDSYEPDIRYFSNQGDARRPSFREAGTNPFGLTPSAFYAAVPTFADIDADGDMDLFVGEIQGGNIYYFENTSRGNR